MPCHVRFEDPHVGRMGGGLHAEKGSILPVGDPIAYVRKEEVHPPALVSIRKHASQGYCPDSAL